MSASHERMMREATAAAASDLDAVVRDVMAAQANETPVMRYDVVAAAEAQSVERAVLSLTTAGDIEPRKVRWLWPGRIPAGMVTLIAGHPGGGKSIFSCDLAARVSCGRAFPDGSPGCEAGDVLIVNVEDPVAEVVVPRLLAANADMSRVKVAGEVVMPGTKRARLFTFADVTELRTAILSMRDCRLVVIDPVGAYLGGRTDSYKDNEVRALLTPLATLAAELGVAIVLIAHTRKSTEGRADDSVLGSRAFTGLARAVWHIACDPNDPALKVLLAGKSNVGLPADGLAFRVVEHPVGPAIAWEPGVIAGTADQVFAEWRKSEHRGPGPANDAERAATNFITAELADGPIAAADMLQRAKAVGISKRTLERAKSDLKVESEKVGPGWVWILPGGQGRQDIAGFD